MEASSTEASDAQNLLVILAPLRNVVDVWQVPYGSCILSVTLDEPGWQYISSPDAAQVSLCRFQRATTGGHDHQQGELSTAWQTSPHRSRCWLCNTKTGIVLDIAVLLAEHNTEQRH